MKKSLPSLVPMISQRISALICLIMLLTLSCGRKNEAREKIASERERWESSISDSIARNQSRKDSLMERMDLLHRKVEDQLASFRCVENPKEVEKYYLPVVTGLSYPLTRTGLTARLTASEIFELIAANGSVRFEQIEVRAGGRTVSSDIVPYDQALNYRSGSLTTVAFSGARADSIGAFIASESSPIALSFIQNGKNVQNVTLSATDAKGISMAWKLADANREMQRTENLFRLLVRRQAILEARKEHIETGKSGQ